MKLGIILLSQKHDEVLSIEEDRLASRVGCTLDELDAYLDDIITGV